MKRIVIAMAAAFGLVVAGGAQAQAGVELAHKNGCMTCHAVETKKMGPSFKDLGAKLKSKSEADIVAAIKASKPHASSKASDADLAALAKWIKSM